MRMSAFISSNGISIDGSAGSDSCLGRYHRISTSRQSLREPASAGSTLSAGNEGVFPPSFLISATLRGRATRKTRYGENPPPTPRELPTGMRWIFLNPMCGSARLPAFLSCAAAGVFRFGLGIDRLRLST